MLQEATDDVKTENRQLRAGEINLKLEQNKIINEYQSKLDRTIQHNMSLTQVNMELSKKNRDLERQLTIEKNKRKEETTIWKMEMEQAKESLHRKTQEIISIETLSDVQLKIKCQLEMELEEKKAKTIAQLHQIQTLQAPRQELQNKTVDRESQEHDYNMESENEIQLTIKSLLNDLVDTIVNNDGSRYYTPPCHIDRLNGGVTMVS